MRDLLGGRKHLVCVERQRQSTCGDLDRLSHYVVRSDVLRRLSSYAVRLSRLAIRDVVALAASQCAFALLACLVIDAGACAVRVERNLIDFVFTVANDADDALRRLDENTGKDEAGLDLLIDGFHGLLLSVPSRSTFSGKAYRLFVQPALKSEQVFCCESVSRSHIISIAENNVYVKRFVLTF